MANELRKFFKQGDHVRVVGGRYEGDTGLIVRVEQNRIVLFSDVTMHELEVLPRDLQLCSDMASGVDSLGQFQWGDLVQLEYVLNLLNQYWFVIFTFYYSPQNVGVIVRIEREKMHILNMSGKLVEAKPQSLNKKKEHRNTIGVDALGSSIQRKDIVKVIDGPHTVILPFVYIYKSTKLVYYVNMLIIIDWVQFRGCMVKLNIYIVIMPFCILV